MECKTSVAINRFSEASTADHSPNLSSFPDDNQKHGRSSLESSTGPFKYYQPNIQEDSKEESDNGDESDYIDDDIFDPAESIFGSEAQLYNQLRESLGNSKEESKQDV